jgi:hypothetical protein
MEAKLSVHHLVRPQDGGRDELSNLATLCGGCHRLTHKAMTASQRQRFSGRRVVHPTSIFPDPLGLEYLPIEGKTVRAPKMGGTKTIRTRGSSGGAEAAERNAYPLVTSLVRLAQRALLPLHGIEKEEGDLVAEEDPRSASA